MTHNNTDRIKNERPDKEELTAAETQPAEAKAKETAEDLAAKIQARRKKVNSEKKRKRMITVTVIILAFVMLAAVYGRDIIRLRAENRELEQQQESLKEEREDLEEELGNTDKQEYIREQARKQLRLLNPGEILFTFDDDDEDGSEEDK